MNLLDDDEMTYPRVCRIHAYISLLINEHITDCERCAKGYCAELHRLHGLERFWGQRVVSLKLREGLL